MGRPMVAVLNGPNLNLLGERDPAVYGTATLADLERLCRATAGELGYDVAFRQTNHEGVLVDDIHELRGTAVGFVVNAAAYSHTSIAIRDALATVAQPVVEVHLSDIAAREPFRHHSYVTEVADGFVSGLGARGYDLAIRRLDRLVRGDAEGAA